MMRSQATIAYRRRYAEQMMLSQLRREIAERYPTPEQRATDEAKLWESERLAELRKARGL
jgi:hypothetical protein